MFSPNVLRSRYYGGGSTVEGSRVIYDPASAARSAGRQVSRRANSGGVAVSSGYCSRPRPRSSSFDRASSSSAATPFDSLSGYRNNRYPLVKGASLSERSSRASSVVSVGSAVSSSDSSPEVDYKVLYEHEKEENEKLMDKMKRLELLNSDVLANNEQQNASDKNNDASYADVFANYDRKTLERRIAELEKLAETIEQLRLDNQRLKEENGALIRVISKLSR